MVIITEFHLNHVFDVTGDVTGEFQTGSGQFKSVGAGIDAVRISYIESFRIQNT